MNRIRFGRAPLHIPTSKRSLIVSCSACASPQWSPVPGDDRIAYGVYASNGSGYNAGIRIVNGDGSNGRTILYSSAHGTNNLMPSWSPDGERIAFISAALGGHHLVSARTNGSDARIVAKLPGQEVAPAWGR